MARLTICIFKVPEGNVCPGRGAIVTTGALTILIVTWRRVNGMARPAIIRQTGMVDVTPIVSIVTVGTLPAQVGVPGRTDVARLAIVVGTMLKSDVSPVGNHVTTGTLTVVVFGWRGMASLEIHKTTVIESVIRPIRHTVVTIRTLSIIVIRRARMTPLAIH